LILAFLAMAGNSAEFLGHGYCPDEGAESDGCANSAGHGGIVAYGGETAQREGAGISPD